MDGHYPPSGYLPMSNQAQQQQQGQQGQQQQQQQPFTGYAGMHPQQHQQPQSANESSTTLPPIQPAGQHFGNLPPLQTNSQYANPNHTPHTPGANSAFSHATSAYSTMSTPVTAGSMPPPSTNYMPGAASYATTQASTHASPASAHPNGLPSSGRMQEIRPMPQPTNFNSPTTPFPPFNHATVVPQQQPHPQYIPSQEAEPTHVVGSQGRRGILPSVPGRPPPPATVTNTSAKSLMPQKDSDGKFPCQHCNKTYLHAKHLKRHLLRHTGDRPYMCHLCKDTFSRSDILKRHFQKCSIRRGNPSGANHLAGRRSTTGSHRGSISTNDSAIGLNNIADGTTTPIGYSAGGMGNGMSNGMGNGMNNSPTINGDQSSYPSSIGTMSARSSRANSLIQPPGAFGDARHMGLGVPTLPSSGTNGDHHTASSAGYASGTPAYMRQHSASNPVYPSYNFANHGSNAGMYAGIKAEDHTQNNYTASAGPMHGGRAHNGANMDWMFSANGHDGYMAGHHPHDSAHVPKTEHPVDGQSFNSTGSYDQNFMNGMPPNAQNYGDDGTTPNDMSLAR